MDHSIGRMCIQNKNCKLSPSMQNDQGELPTLLPSRGMQSMCDQRREGRTKNIAFPHRLLQWSPAKFVLLRRSPLRLARGHPLRKRLPCEGRRRFRISLVPPLRFGSKRARTPNGSVRDEKNAGHEQKKSNVYTNVKPQLH